MLYSSPMKTFFEPILFPADQDRLVSFLTSEEWPFHVNSSLSSDKVLAMIEEGAFDGSNNECFWILDESQKDIGFIRLFERNRKATDCYFFV